LELRHLRYFCALADFGTFSKAGEYLHISPSAISEQVADLECEVGGSLLDRSHRRTRLTPQGQLLLEETRKILLASEHAIEVTRRAINGELGALSVGFFRWGTQGFFAHIIREYRKLYPEVRLSFVRLGPGVKWKPLSTGKIDIGFTRSLEPSLNRMLQNELLFREPIVVALPQDHALAGPSVDITAIAAESFVMRDRAEMPLLFDDLLALCLRSGYSPRIANTTST
jgi:DNA-binding transcriptional LysR family regulator